ncbi:hypothetical protein [Acinetobacter brisouii]|uniref:hypothetical protein n=1 Tax=Acinetobacter brisouii TaxID=396323 RepID=UPI00124C3FD3|nr:hypothetical protein [Acinetobacter brisouii]
MGLLLDLINEDQSLEYISLKEAINLIAEKTKSNIYEVSTYLLNRNIESLLCSYTRGIDYKLNVSSSPEGNIIWIGENSAFKALIDIAKEDKNSSPISISSSSKYAKNCEETFWRRKEFFSLESIKILELLDSTAFNLNQQQKNDALIAEENENENDDFLNESINLKAKITSPLEIDKSEQYKNGGHIIIDDEDKKLAYEDNYRRKFQSIRWSYWFEKPTIACHEAVLLSLGLDPEIIYYPQRKWATELKSSDRHALEERILNFEQLIGKGKLFESNTEGDLKTPVSLKKLAKYLHKRKAKIPQQLMEYINKNIEINNQSAAPFTVEQYHELLRENEQLKEKIKKLESLNSSIPAEAKVNNLLNLIFDDTAQDRYAPDLALSIKLWEDLYIKNPKTDSHSNRANQWIDANTAYGDTSKAKLREITTPLINWSTHRDKNFKK